jgi:PKD repeat protein
MPLKELHNHYLDTNFTYTYFDPLIVDNSDYVYVQSNSPYNTTVSLDSDFNVIDTYTSTSIYKSGYASDGYIIQEDNNRITVLSSVNGIMSFVTDIVTGTSVHYVCGDSQYIFSLVRTATTPLDIWKVVVYSFNGSSISYLTESPTYTNDNTWPHAYYKNNKLYLCAGPLGFRIYNFNGATISLVSSITSSTDNLGKYLGAPYCVFVDDQYIYATRHNIGLFVYDKSTLELLYTYPMSYSSGVTARFGIIYVSEYGSIVALRIEDGEIKKLGYFLITLMSSWPNSNIMSVNSQGVLFYGGGGYGIGSLILEEPYLIKKDSVGYAMVGSFRNLPYLQFPVSHSESVIVGDYLYTISKPTTIGSYVLEVLDISTPEFPVSVSQTPHPLLSGNRGLKRSGNILYTFGGSSSTDGFIVILDISIPTSPSVLGHLQTGEGRIKEIDISRLPYLYASVNDYNKSVVGNNKISIFDVSDPGSITEVQAIDYPVNVWAKSSIKIVDNYFYMFYQSAEDVGESVKIRVYDITNDLSPVFLSDNTAYSDGLDCRVSLYNNFLLVPHLRNIVTYDISNRENPTIAQVFPTKTEYNEYSNLNGNSLFVSSYFSGTREYSVDSLGRVTYIAILSIHALDDMHQTFVSVSGDYYFVSSINTGIGIYNKNLYAHHYGYQDETGLSVYDFYYPDWSYYYQAESVEDYYVVGEGSALIFAQKEGYSLKTVSVFTGSNDETKFFVYGTDILYWADETAGLRVLNISDKNNVSEFTVITGGYKCFDVCVVDNVLYTIWDDGLRAYNIATPSLPTIIDFEAVSTTYYQFRRFFVRGSYVYIANRYDSIDVYSFLGNQFSFITNIKDKGTDYDGLEILAADEDYLYAFNYASLSIYNVGSWERVKSMWINIDWYGTYSGTVKDKKAYIADGDYGLCILNLEDINSIYWEYRFSDEWLGVAPYHISFGPSDTILLPTSYAGFMVFGETSPPATLFCEFSGTPLSGPPGLRVQFTDLSVGSPVSWVWVFGDGHTSTLRNPEHVYSTVGVFTVKLIVTDNLTIESREKIGYVIITNSRVATPDIAVLPDNYNSYYALKSYNSKVTLVNGGGVRVY